MLHQYRTETILDLSYKPYLKNVLLTNTTIDIQNTSNFFFFHFSLTFSYHIFLITFDKTNFFFKFSWTFLRLSNKVNKKFYWGLFFKQRPFEKMVILAVFFPFVEKIPKKKKICIYIFFLIKGLCIISKLKFFFF